MKSGHIRDLPALVDWVRRGERPKHLFFRGHRAERDRSAGRTYRSGGFLLDDVRYPTAEHYMMAEKARLFGNDEALLRILPAPNPGAAQRLGCGVHGFKRPAVGA